VQVWRETSAALRILLGKERANVGLMKRGQQLGGKLGQGNTDNLEEGVAELDIFLLAGELQGLEDDEKLERRKLTAAVHLERSHEELYILDDGNNIWKKGSTVFEGWIICDNIQLFCG